MSNSCQTLWRWILNPFIGLGMFLIFLWVGILSEMMWIILVPSGLAIGFILFQNPILTYYTMIGMIPLSIAVDLPGGLATDFPSELLTVAMMIIFWIHILKYDLGSMKSIFNSKLIWWILIMLFWTIISVFYAEIKIISIKFVLAKLWFLTSYLFCTIYIVRKDKNQLKIIFWILFITTTITGIFSFIRTAIGGFQFDQTNYYSLPFYDNHVFYATSLTMILPWIFYACTWYEKGSVIRAILKLSIPFYMVAIYFSYTRACYLALLIGLGATILIRFHGLAKGYILTVVLTVSVLFYFSKDYTYLKLAPDYNTTVMHNEFKDHLISTFYGKDASSMERLNMWISVFRMYKERPIVGYGPNNFPHCYKPYSVMYFKTWVSDNPLKLSCHNYFWLLLAEQGVIGCILFVVFIGLVFYAIEGQFRNGKDIGLMLMLAAVTATYCTMLFFNDLLETLKNGAIFFIYLAILIAFSRSNKHVQTTS